MMHLSYIKLRSWDHGSFCASIIGSGGINFWDFQLVTNPSESITALLKWEWSKSKSCIDPTVQKKNKIIIIITGYAQAFHSFLFRSFWMKRTQTRLENFPSVLPPRGFLLRCFRSVGAVVALRGCGGFVRRRCRRLPQTSGRRSPGRASAKSVF